MTEFLIAEAAIRQLHAQFVDAAWRQDADAFAGMFAEDGVWKIAGMEIVGRDEIRSTFARLLGACERVSMIVNPPLLEVRGGEATSRTYVTEFARMKADGAFAMTIGTYHDWYVETGEGWRFRRRHFGLQYRGPADLTGSFVEGSDQGAFPAMPALDAPTFTRRKA